MYMVRDSPCLKEFEMKTPVLLCTVHGQTSVLVEIFTGA